MDTTAEALVERFRAGDEDAARELFDRFGGEMLRLVRRLLAGSRNRAALDSEQAVQDGFRSFLSAIEKPGFDPAKGRVAGLLARIVAMKARVQLRRKYPANLAPEDIGAVREVTAALLDAQLTEPEAEIALQERLAAALEECTPKEREILALWLDRRDERSVEEVARACRRAVATVERVIAEFTARLEQLTVPDPGP